MELYNYRSRKSETFKPLKGKTVGLYTCGPTVYDAVHIGNLRTYVFEDVLKRALKLNGYPVKHVMNITDIDDKIIERARANHESIDTLAHRFETQFYTDLRLLNIEPANKYPRATEHIAGMIALIKTLIGKGLAYEKAGSVYYDISKFVSYGNLSQLKLRELKIGASTLASGRIDADEYAKDAAQDFVLWKAKKDGEPSWPSPWGEGRPGWHIECSAMSTNYLGQPFDIHAGGVDLLFPHHENEIAQSEGAADKLFAQFFIEGEHLMVDGKKMSKSLGNMYTLNDVIAHKIEPLAFRYFVLTSHYRSPLNFTWETVEGASHTVKRIQERGAMLAQMPKVKNSAMFRKKFSAHMLNDLDTPQALAVFWDSFDSLSFDDFIWADAFFGLNLNEKSHFEIPAAIKKLADERETVRKNKDWKRADEIREEIEKAGWIVEDTPQGIAFKPVRGPTSKF